MDGVNERFDFTTPVPPVDELGRVHLVAVGGAGMSAVARLLLERGVTVSGSDAADGPALEALRDSGARVQVGHDPAGVADVDTVVISSAIREDNVELAAARAAGLPVPRQESVRSEDQAVAAARRIGYPVVLKPLDGNHGRGVCLDLQDEADVRAAYPPAMIGRALSVFTMAMFMGVALMQWATGWVASQAAGWGVEPFTAVLLAIAAALLVGALGYQWLPQPPQQQRAPA